MKDTCTLNAVELIDMLALELSHLHTDGMRYPTTWSVEMALAIIYDHIRSEYARLHPHKTMPQSTVPSAPLTNSEACTKLDQ